MSLLTTTSEYASQHIPKHPLPFTGSDLTIYVLAGSALVGFGFFLRRVRDGR